MERMTEKPYLAEDQYMKCSENCNVDMDCVDSGLKQSKRGTRGVERRPTMSDEYISRERTLTLLKSLGSRDYRREKGTIQDAIKMISSSKYTPAADVVPVVRCRDCESCRKLNRKNADENNYVEGVLWCTSLDWGVWPDDFCSYGERRPT